MKKDICSFEFMDEQFDKLPEKIRRKLDESSYTYIFSKAARFIKDGPKKYREADALQMPKNEWNLTKIKEGCRQIVYECKGITAMNCISELSEPEFKTLMELFHYEHFEEKYYIAKRGNIIIKGIFRHVVTGDVCILYYQIT
jgi:hypothetical protein